MEDNEKQVMRGEQEEGRKNKSWTDRWRSGTLAFGTARPVSETRRFEPEGEEEQGRQKGRRGRRREGFSLKYVDPRATLGLFSLHPAGCSGRVPVRHAGRERERERESVYIV